MVLFWILLASLLLTVPLAIIRAIVYFFRGKDIFSIGWGVTSELFPLYIAPLIAFNTLLEEEDSYWFYSAFAGGYTITAVLAFVCTLAYLIVNYQLRSSETPDGEVQVGGVFLALGILLCTALLVKGPWEITSWLGTFFVAVIALYSMAMEKAYRRTYPVSTERARQLNSDLLDDLVFAERPSAGPEATLLNTTDQSSNLLRQRSRWTYYVTSFVWAGALFLAIYGIAFAFTVG